MEDKTTSLDEMVRKFRQYVEDGGDYDELDFKADLIDWRQQAVSELADNMIDRIRDVYGTSK